MAQENSTTSSPRPTSPLASSNVLPCSSDISRARSSVRFSIRLLRLNITRWRRSGGVAAHFSCACLAICTAWSTSASEAKVTLAVTSPVAGLVTSPERPLLPATRLLSMKCPISVAIFSSRTIEYRRVLARPGRGLYRGLLQRDAGLAGPRCIGAAARRDRHRLPFRQNRLGRRVRAVAHHRALVGL